MGSLLSREFNSICNESTCACFDVRAGTPSTSSTSLPPPSQVWAGPSVFCCPAIVPGVDNLELPSEPFPVSFCLGRNDEQVRVRVRVRVRVSGRNDEQVLNKHG